MITTPQQIAELLCEIIATRRLTASIYGGYGTGKTTVLVELIKRLEPSIGTHHIAVFASTGRAIERLRDMVGEPFPELCGTPADALLYHSTLPGDEGRINLNKVAKQYLVDVVARINNLQPTPMNAAWLYSLRPRVWSALQADLESRLEQVPLPHNAYLYAIAEYCADYKAEHRLLDRADLVHGDYHQSPHIQLLIFDELSDADRSYVMRSFPNASIIATSHEAIDADIDFPLHDCLRKPNRLDIVDDDPEPQLAPPPHEDFRSLFIIAPRWRWGKWLDWCLHHSIPPPIEIRNWYRQRDHCEAVLNRYGRLRYLPIVRMGRAEAFRHCEADHAIIDSEISELAASRAVHSLVTFQKRL